MAERKLIVAIDGPSGAGKSTLSKLLARKLDYLNIDTGAMYRSVAWATRDKGIDPNDRNAIQKMCQDLEIAFDRSEGCRERVLVDGADVTDAIRSPENSLLTAHISAIPEVRDALVTLQRKMGEQGGVVLEGRDIGTVVFPEAEAKFFLSASAEERGRRRYEELRAKGVETSLSQTVADIIARDEADTLRAHAPLIQAGDAVVIDSTTLTIEEVLKQMFGVVRERERVKAQVEK